MADQIPPEMAEALAEQQAPPEAAAPPVPPEEVDGEIKPEIEEALENAVLQMARKAAGATQAQDAKDYSESALKLAQALIITNPELVAPQGVAPDKLGQGGVPLDAANPSGMNPLMPVDKSAGSARSISGREGPTVPAKPAAK